MVQSERERGLRSGCCSEALGAREVHLWLLRPAAAQAEPLLRAYRSLLAPDEVAQQERFRFDRLRREHLLARALVRCTLSRYLPVEPADWRFERTRHGRPEIVGPAGLPPLRFNLSHTEGLIACAVALGREVGVDVECLDRRSDTVAIADRFFSPFEVSALRALPAGDQHDRFFDYWTLKEAYIKARGLGLALPLEAFSFELREEAAISIAFEPAIADDPLGWRFFLLRPGPRHRAAVAVERRAPAEEVQLLTRETVPLSSARPACL